MEATNERYFFEEGIDFTCTECGQCCSGDPGIVRITEAEVHALAAALGVSVGILQAEYLRVHAGEWGIKERENGDCVFLKENRCSVYDVRPRQCRTFPFWVSNLRNARNWDKTCKRCPGIGQGRHYSFEEIMEILSHE